MFKKRPNIPGGTGKKCAVCGKDQANATCAQCGGAVCPSHSHYINGTTYCQRCLSLCPKCKSPQITAHKGGFDTGGAVAGWLLGGPIIGGLIGLSAMNDVNMFCHSCGHRWRPRL